MWWRRSGEGGREEGHEKAGQGRRRGAAADRHAGRRQRPPASWQLKKCVGGAASAAANIRDSGGRAGTAEGNLPPPWPLYLPAAALPLHTHDTAFMEALP